MSDRGVSSLPPAAATRIAPLASPAGITRLPLALVFGYVAATFLLFLTWPINWPIYYAGDWARLIAYVLLCLAVIGAAAIAGSAGSTRIVAPLPHVSILLIAGAALAALLLIPSSFAYTGRGPWDVFDALGDQGAAYRRLQAQLVATSGQRNLIVVLRALASPLTYVVLPLGIIRWRSIGWASRGAVIVWVSTSLIFSILRGTDKEIADLIVVAGASAFVGFGRSSALGSDGVTLLRRHWKAIVAAIACVLMAQALFTTRKDERLGGYVGRTVVCANDSRICADLDNPWISWLPLRQRFGLTFFILSTCSGYYGLELAMEKPFDTSFGVGHSPAALTVYETLTGDNSLRMRTYTYRNGQDHWSDEFYWSTLIAWIANDVGFPGAVPILALIGFLWGLWWREAAAGMSDPAAVLFVAATTAIFYLPANDQFLASYDGYFVLAAWVPIWLWHRANRVLLAQTQAVPDTAGR